jgi:hypothetical protein
MRRGLGSNRASRLDTMFALPGSRGSALVGAAPRQLLAAWRAGAWSMTTCHKES